MNWKFVLALSAAALAVLPSAAGAAGKIDGPGSYYMVRSFDTGQPFNQEQEQACIDYYGAARAATAVDLNAALFTVDGDPETGRVVDQKTGYLGPGFGCLAATADPELLELFVGASPPLFGLTRLAGTCPSSPVPTQPGALLLNCRLPIFPEPSTGGLGGLGTSATVINPKNAVPGVPTGSLWTVYSVPRKGVEFPPPVGGDAPSGLPEPTPGLDFYVFRTSRDQVAASSSRCPQALLAPVVGARSSTLHPAEPDAQGQISPELGARRGGLTVCFTGAGTDRRTATGLVEVRRGGRTVQVSTAGDCRDFPTPAGATLRQQACNLKVESSTDPQISGGAVTSNGLVHASAPLKAANSHVWTLALFVES